AGARSHYCPAVFQERLSEQTDVCRIPTPETGPGGACSGSDGYLGGSAEHQACDQEARNGNEARAFAAARPADCGGMEPAALPPFRAALELSGPRVIRICFMQ